MTTCRYCGVAYRVDDPPCISCGKPVRGLPVAGLGFVTSNVHNDCLERWLGRPF